ncbi:RNA polymerase sigma factor [Chloroflexota bacterium]
MQQEPEASKTAELNLLISGAVNGSARDFGKMYDLFVESVYRHIYYRVGNARDAEDLTQQTFLKAWKAIGKYKITASPFKAWLIKISHNLIIDFYRSRKSEIYIDFDIISSKPESDPALLAEANFSQNEIRQAINKLHGDQQQVILMRYIEDFSYPEIAVALGKSEGTIRVILHRGLTKLKTILDKDQ